MAADAGIFQQYLNPVRSVADYRGDMDKQEQNALTLAAGRLSNQTSQQALADDQAARQASTASGGDQAKFVNALQAAGLYKQAAAQQKTLLESQESQAKITHFGAQSAEATQKTASARSEAIGQTLGALSKIDGGATSEHVTRAMQHLVDIGQVSAEMAQKIVAGAPADPSQMQGWLLQGQRAVLGVKDQLPKFQTIDTGGAVNTGTVDPVTGTFAPAKSMAKTQTPDSVASVARAAADAKAGRAQADRHFNTAQDNTKGQIVQTDSGPVLVNTRTGAGKLVTGPDGSALPGITKPLNDSQSKALLFGTRMQEAHKILATLADEGAVTSVPGSRAPLIGGAINAFSSDNQQMLDQAKRDFMTAVLRRESGASISSGEYDNADKQYFPQIGERDPKVIAQKARNRELAINGILVEVPEKQRGAITPKAAPMRQAASTAYSDAEKERRYQQFKAGQK